MKKTYTIKQAQTEISGIVCTVEQGGLITITQHQKPVAYILSPQRLSELLETIEILADPQAIRNAEAGRGKARDAKGLPR